MTRARFAEGIAQLHGKVDTAKAFLTGMMSLMDAILDEPIESVMNKLPLAKEIKDALVEHQGVLADYVRLIQFYEQGLWQEASQNIEQLNLPADKVPDAYHTAVQWANEQMKALGE